MPITFTNAVSFSANGNEPATFTALSPIGDGNCGVGAVALGIINLLKKNGYQPKITTTLNTVLSTARFKDDMIDFVEKRTIKYAEHPKLLDAIQTLWAALNCPAPDINARVRSLKSAEDLAALHLILGHALRHIAANEMRKSGANEDDIIRCQTDELQVSPRELSFLESPLGISIRTCVYTHENTPRARGIRLETTATHTGIATWDMRTPIFHIVSGNGHFSLLMPDDINSHFFKTNLGLTTEQIATAGFPNPDDDPTHLSIPLTPEDIQSVQQKIETLHLREKRYAAEARFYYAVRSAIAKINIPSTSPVTEEEINAINDKITKIVQTEKSKVITLLETDPEYQGIEIFPADYVFSYPNPLQYLPNDNPPRSLDNLCTLYNEEAASCRDIKSVQVAQERERLEAMLGTASDKDELNRIVERICSHDNNRILGCFYEYSDREYEFEHLAQLSKEEQARLSLIKKTLARLIIELDKRGLYKGVLEGAAHYCVKIQKPALPPKPATFIKPKRPDTTAKEELIGWLNQDEINRREKNQRRTISQPQTATLPDNTLGLNRNLRALLRALDNLTDEQKKDDVCKSTLSLMQSAAGEERIQCLQEYQALMQTLSKTESQPGTKTLLAAMLALGLVFLATGILSACTISLAVPVVALLVKSLLTVLLSAAGATMITTASMGFWTLNRPSEISATGSQLCQTLVSSNFVLAERSPECGPK